MSKQVKNKRIKEMSRVKKNTTKVKDCPDLMRQIHPTLNMDYERICNLSVGSHVKVIWYCPKTFDKCTCPHIYEMEIRAKYNTIDKCQYCDGRAFCEHTSLAGLYPDLMKYWHPTKNGDMDPRKTSPGTHDKAWWLCNDAECGCVHEYEQEIRSRIKSKECLYCKNILVDYHESIHYLYPEKMKEWYYEKNDELGLDPRKLTPNSQFNAYWKCKKGCKYKDEPPCSENVNKEDCQHISLSTIQNRIFNDTECPYCIKTPQKICYHQSLEFLYPDIAKEWDYERNGDLKPYQVSRCSDKKVHWKCDVGCKYKDSCNDDACHHRWESLIPNRTSNNRKCPYCLRGTDKVCFHQSLAFLGEKHLSEWDYEKNNVLPENISYKSDKSAHWKCKNGHSYTCTLNTKIRGKYCPECKCTTEKKLMGFLQENLNYSIQREKKFDFCKNLYLNSHFRFDFYIKELNLVIELDGVQHFENIDHWNTDYEFGIYKDIYKMYRVNYYNISVIRLLTLDVYENRNDWASKLFEVINEIKESKECANYYINNQNEYESHINLYDQIDEKKCLEIFYNEYKSYKKYIELRNDGHITHPHILKLIEDDQFNDLDDK